MDVPRIPENILHKAEDPAKLRKTEFRQSAAMKTYKTAAANADEVVISTESKLLQKLRGQYENLEGVGQEKVNQLKMAASAVTITLSAEEIVKKILQGTLFELV